MSARVIVDEPIGIVACDCLTPLGDARATAAALNTNRIALKRHPVLGADGGDEVPLALCGELQETVPPRWLAPVRQLAAAIPDAPWGEPEFPVFVTSSNFGVGSLHAYTRSRTDDHLRFGVPHRSVEFLAQELGWGREVATISHACVSAHLGLLLATRHLHAGLARRALVLTFDFLSPFVTGGFNSLKILNGGMPAPYCRREIGSIGLGDGAAFAVLAPITANRGETRGRITAQSFYNEMHHFTGNQPDGAGFIACLEPIAASLADRRAWIKGHGTGTLEAGRLEAEACARLFPDAPLVSWKGSLGHTLGSCGIVELAITLAAMDAGHIPGTIGAAPPTFTPEVALAPFLVSSFAAAVLTSNAFGGAHAALVLERG